MFKQEIIAVPNAPVFNRPDTLLGVGEALGQDLGFNPIWLRIAMAVGVLWNPWAMIAAYVALGVAVAIARWLTPAPKANTVQPAAEPAAGNDDGVILWAEAA